MFSEVGAERERAAASVPRGEKGINQSWPVAFLCKKKKKEKGSFRGAGELGTKAKHIQFEITP